MDGPKVYDKAKWHYDGDFPSDLPPEQGFVHTGLFLAWLIANNLLDPEFEGDWGETSEAVRSRAITGPQAFQRYDGVLADDMLSEEGNAFTQAYFEFETGAYLSDYEELLSNDLPTMYHVADTWQNYEKLEPRLNERFAKWRAAKP